MDNLNNTENISKNIKIDITLLKDIRNFIEITIERINFKSLELLPVGLLIQKIDDIIKENN